MSKTIHITRIEPVMLGKINALFGLVVGIIFGLLSLVSSGIVSNYLLSAGVAVDLVEKTQALGFYGLIFSLLFGVVFGFVSGAGAAMIYNFLVKIIGGIQLEVDE